MSDDRYREVARRGLEPLVTDLPEGPEWEELRNHPIPRRRRVFPAWAAAALATVVVVVMVGALPLLSQRPGPETSSLATTSAMPTATTPLSAGGTAPIRSPLPGWTAAEIPREQSSAWNEAMAWTGTEILLWGGEWSNAPIAEPGLAFDVQRGAWREIAPTPSSPTYGSAAVWTGTELIVCCGVAGSSVAVAYDPANDTWRRLTDAPLAPGYAEAAWTGDEAIVVARDGAAAYDPGSDGWRRLPEPAGQLGIENRLVWTGDELVVWPADTTRQTFRGMAYSPEDDTWRLLPEPPAWPAVPDVVWTGEHLIVWGGLPAARAGESERAVGSRLDMATGVWTALPEVLPEPEPCECNLGTQSAVWTGERMVVMTGFLGSGAEPDGSLLLAYDPATDLWRHLGTMPWMDDTTMTMAGTRLVVRADHLYLSDHGGTMWGTPIAEGGLTGSVPPQPVYVPTVAMGSDGVARGPEVTLAATNGNRSISILDMTSETRTDYGASMPSLGGPIALTITRQGDMIVWPEAAGAQWGDAGPVLHRGGKAGGPSLGGLDHPDLALGTLVGSVDATDDGRRAWIWEHPSRVELVDLSTGASLAIHALPDGYQPVFTAGDDLVIAGEQDFRVLDTAGNLGPPVDGMPIEANAEVVAWQRCEGSCILLVGDPARPDEAKPVTLPLESDRWESAGLVTIPTDSALLPTVSPDGRQMLVEAVTGQAYETRRLLVAVDLETAQARTILIQESARWSPAFWDRTGDHIILLTQTDNGNDVSIIDASTLQRRDIPDALPDGYWVLGAG